MKPIALAILLLIGCSRSSSDDVRRPVADLSWAVTSDTTWRGVFNIGTHEHQTLDGSGNMVVDAVDSGDVCATVVKLTDSGIVTLTVLPDGYSATATESWRAVTLCIPGSF